MLVVLADGCGRIRFDDLNRGDASGGRGGDASMIAGLIHWWKLDEAPGATMMADSAGGANLTRDPGTATFVAGKLGNALLLPADGTENNSHVATPTDVLGQTALTLSYWNKRSSLEGAIGQDNGGTSNTRISIAPWDDGNVYFSIGSDTSDDDGYIVLTDTNWHLYTMVFDGTGVGNVGRLHGYLDGVEQTLTFQGTIASHTTSTATTFQVGDGLSNQTSFSGYYDDIRIYDRALTAAEVATLYSTTGGT